MRVVLLWVVVVVIGLTWVRWLGNKPPAPSPSPPTSEHAPPPAPTRPQDLQAFERDINRFMQDAATQRAGREEK